MIRTDVQGGLSIATGLRHVGSIARGQVRAAHDPWIVFPALLIFVISLAALFAVVYHPDAREISPFQGWSNVFTRQLVWGLGGLAVMYYMASVRFGAHANKTPAYYLGALLILGLVLLVGIKVRNIRAWLALGPLTFQPSELCKLAIIFALARYLAPRARLARPFVSLAIAAAIVAIPAALVLKQPDMGTVIVYASLLMTVPFISGLPSRYLVLATMGIIFAAMRILLFLADEYLNILAPESLIASLISDISWAKGIFAGFLVLAIAVWFIARALRMKNAFSASIFLLVPAGAYLASFYLLEHLKPYQKMRLFSFISPSLDPRGAGYNLLQSEIAFGSGGMIGRGMDGVTQSALGFLPERQTDFIFSVIGELFGFAGSLVVIGAFIVLTLRILWIASNARSRFGALVAVGIATVLTTHVLVNIGMAIGMMPIMGIPLPLASYGGTALITAFAMLGTVMAIERESKLNPGRAGSLDEL